MSLCEGMALADRYVVRHALGEGGMGAAYLVEDQRLGRPCVIKESLAYDAASRDQFEREARLLASLQHPNLPVVHDYFFDQDRPYIVMQYVEGMTLDHLRDDRAVPFEANDVLRWAQDLLDALRYMHSHEPPIIHRDIKPSNVCITPEGKAVLLDFGIARRLDESQTRTAAQAFTSGYAPIEQYPENKLRHVQTVQQYVEDLRAEGIRTGPYTDVYGVGATLYYMLTLSPPLHVGMRVLGEELQPVQDVHPNVPNFLVSAVMKALALHPRERFQSAAEMLDALQPQTIHDVVEVTTSLQDVLDDVHLADGEILFHRGDRGDAFYIVESGRVRIFTHDKEGQELVLNTMGPREGFGEMSLVDGRPRSASVAAIGPTTLRRLRQKDFSAKMRTSPVLTDTVIRLLSQRIRHTTEQLERIGHQARLVAEGRCSPDALVTQAFQEYWNVRLATLGRYNILVEGITDKLYLELAAERYRQVHAIDLLEGGAVRVVAGRGTKHMGPEFGVLQSLEAQGIRFVVILDGDDAGRMAAEAMHRFGAQKNRHFFQLERKDYRDKGGKSWDVEIEDMLPQALIEAFVRQHPDAVEERFQRRDVVKFVIQGKSAEREGQAYDYKMMLVEHVRQHATLEDLVPLVKVLGRARKCMGLETKISQYTRCTK